MRTLVVVLTLLSASVAFSQAISSGDVSVEAVTDNGAIVGFRVDVAEGQSIPVTFGSLGNITAGRDGTMDFND